MIGQIGQEMAQLVQGYFGHVKRKHKTRSLPWQDWQEVCSPDIARLDQETEEFGSTEGTPSLSDVRSEKNVVIPSFEYSIISVFFDSTSRDNESRIKLLNSFGGVEPRI